MGVSKPHDRTLHGHLLSRLRALLAGAAVTVMAGWIAPSSAGAVPTVAPTCFNRTVTIFAVPGATTHVTSGSDVILGTSGDDMIEGLGGDDYICGMGGDDNIYGDGSATTGNDHVDGGLGNNTLHGGSGKRPALRQLRRRPGVQQERSLR